MTYITIISKLLYAKLSDSERVFNVRSSMMEKQEPKDLRGTPSHSLRRVTG